MCGWVRGCVGACMVGALVNVRILVYHTSTPPLQTSTADMVRPATPRCITVETRSYPCPGNRASALLPCCPALCPVSCALLPASLLQFPRDHRPQVAWRGVDDLADQSRSLLMLGRGRPVCFERVEIRVEISIKIRSRPATLQQTTSAAGALSLIQCRRSQHYATPTHVHMRYSPRHLAVDEPGALVMADRPFQPGRTWRTGERPGLPGPTVTQLSSLLQSCFLLGGSESTTHGPWR